MLLMLIHARERSKESAEAPNEDVTETDPKAIEVQGNKVLYHVLASA